MSANAQVRTEETSVVATRHEQIGCRTRRRSAVLSGNIRNRCPVRSRGVRRNPVSINHHARLIRSGPPTTIIGSRGQPVLQGAEGQWTTINHLARSVGILAGRNRIHLVVFVRSRKMHARTAHVGNGGNRAPTNIVLHIDMPLLHVRPNRFVRQAKRTAMGSSWRQRRREDSNSGRHSPKWRHSSRLTMDWGYW